MFIVQIFFSIYQKLLVFHFPNISINDIHSCLPNFLVVSVSPFIYFFEFILYIFFDCWNFFVLIFSVFIIFNGLFYTSIDKVFNFSHFFEFIELNYLNYSSIFFIRSISALISSFNEPRSFADLSILLYLSFRLRISK